MKKNAVNKATMLLNLRKAVLVFIGSLIAAMGVSMFLSPCKIVSGGLAGLSTTLHYAFGFSLGATPIVANILLLFIAYWILGKEFVMKTVGGAFSFSVLLEILSHFEPMTENVFIAAIFGGLLFGLGIGISFSAGGSTGGTDIVGRLVQHYFPSFPIGKAMLFVDGLVIASSLLVFGDRDLIFLGVISLFISSYMVDWVIKRLNVSRIAFVVTSKGAEVTQHLISTSPRGVTVIDVSGGFTNERKQILFCAMKQKEVEDFNRKVKQIDENSFVVFSESQEILGNGFMLYR